MIKPPYPPNVGLPAHVMAAPTASTFGRYCTEQADWCLSTAAATSMRTYARERFGGDEPVYNGRSFSNRELFDIAEEFGHEHARRFATAPLYYLTAEMTEFAVDAADRMPGGGLRLEEIPSTEGIMGFALPPMTLFIEYTAEEIEEMRADLTHVEGVDRVAAPIMLISWRAITEGGTFARENCVWLSAFLPGAPDRMPRWHLTYEVMIGLSDEYGSPTPPGLEPDGAMPETEEWGEIAHHRLAHIMRSAWLLMAQSKLVETDTVGVTRQQRRQAERNRTRPPRDINVIRIGTRARDVTRIQSMSDAELDEHRRRITVRYPVRGHDRMQACGPGRTERKRIWIDPHWRGPDGAPIHYSRTVNLLDTPHGED